MSKKEHTLPGTIRHFRKFAAGWRENNHIIMLPADTKGFLMDLHGLLITQCVPYGFCSIVNHTKKKELLETNSLQHLVNQTANTPVTADSYINVLLSVGKSIENTLDRLVPYTPEQVSTHIQILEDALVLGRTQEGFLYSRFLFDVSQKHLTAIFQDQFNQVFYGEE